MGRVSVSGLHAEHRSEAKAIKAHGGWPEFWDGPAEIEDAELLKFIRRCKSRRAEMLNALRRRKKEHGDRAGSRLARRYMRSWSARVSVMAMVYARRVGPLRDLEAEQLRDILDFAQLVDPFGKRPERMFALPKTKRTGGERYVFASGIAGHAIDLMVKDIEDALVDLHPTQFGAKGGLAAMERWLAQRLPSAKLVITTDIPSCYEHVRRSSVVDGSPLPGSVMKAVLFDPKDRAVFLKRAPKGLAPIEAHEVAEVSSPGGGVPQGSAAAARAVEAVMANIVDAMVALGGGVHAATQGDNIIICLDDPSLLPSVISTLTTEVSRHFDTAVLGELTRRIKVAKPKDGVFFCGKTYRWANGRLKMSVSSERIGEWGATMHSKIADAAIAKDAGELERLESSIFGWAHHYNFSKHAINEVVEALLYLRDRKNNLYNGTIRNTV